MKPLMKPGFQIAIVLAMKEFIVMKRLMSPMIKKDDQWQEISWKDALIEIVEKLKVVENNSAAVLASPNSTLEEFYLLSRLSDELSISNIDHRLRMVDFTDQLNDPKIPLLGINIAEIENCKQIVVVGSDIRKEAPIIGSSYKKSGTLWCSDWHY